MLTNHHWTKAGDQNVKTVLLWTYLNTSCIECLVNRTHTQNPVYKT